MATVVMHAVVSVDGYIADDNDDVGPLFEWYFNGDLDLVDGGPFKVSPASVGYVRPMWASIGSVVIGRHLFDLTNGWEASRRLASMWWWGRIGPSRTGGIRRRRTTSSTTWQRDRESEGACWRTHRCGRGR